MRIFISAEEQYGRGAYLGRTANGQAVHEGGSLSHLYDIDTNVSNSIVAKAVNAGCLLKATPHTVEVSFKSGSDAGKVFEDSVNAVGVPKGGVHDAYTHKGYTYYSFSKRYALGLM